MTAERYDERMELLRQRLEMRNNVVEFPKPKLCGWRWLRNTSGGVHAVRRADYAELDTGHSVSTACGQPVTSGWSTTSVRLGRCGLCSRKVKNER